MMDEEFIKNVRRKIEKRNRYKENRRKELLRKKEQGLCCQIDDCLRTIKDNFRGGKYCKTHGQIARAEYGKKNGLCTYCGEAERDGKFLKCRKCLDNMSRNRSNWDKGKTNSSPLALLTIKRYGIKVLK